LNSERSHNSSKSFIFHHAHAQSMVLEFKDTIL
jgi:hypothetical protein